MKLFIVRKSFLIAVACIVAAGAAFGIIAGTNAARASARDASRPTVVIDAGHGGIDAGVLGKSSGVKESDINLSIAKELRAYFAGAGFNCVMTRTSSSGLYGTTEKGFKMRDMKKRKEIIENADPDMVISVHQNFFPLPSRRGGTVFYDKNSEQGKELAIKIQAELNSLPECERANEILVGDYYMLKCTQSPSVIVECGFLSNAEDERLLRDGNYQKSVAYSIFKGAVTYLAD